MLSRCNVCGGETVEGTDYTAPSDRDARMLRFPSVACLACHAIRPDPDRIARMNPQEVPTGVRIRCASMRPWDPCRSKAQRA